MAVRIDRAVTDVIPEPEPATGQGAQPSEAGDGDERLRQGLERMRRIALRTRSEGFDD